MSDETRRAFIRKGKERKGKEKKRKEDWIGMVINPNSKGRSVCA